MTIVQVLLTIHAITMKGWALQFSHDCHDTNNSLKIQDSTVDDFCV